MNLNKIFQRMVNILIAPQKEWDVVKGESGTVQDLVLKYAVFVGAIPVIAGFLGFLILGLRYGFGGFLRYAFVNSILWVILVYALLIGAAILLGVLIDALAPGFGGSKDMLGSMKVAIYTFTVVWVAGAIYFLIGIAPTLPFLLLVLLASGYSFYLFYTGLAKIKGTPPNNILVFSLISTGILEVEVLLVYLIGNAVMRISYGIY